MRRVLCAVALMLLVVLIVPLHGAATTTDEAEIRATILRYFEGVTKYDEEALREAFMADAFIMASGQRGLFRMPFERWVRFVDGEAPSDTAAYRNGIISIDVAGNAAVVKTDLHWPEVRYIDYLSMLKVDGQWKIANKIFHSERPE